MKRLLIFIIATSALIYSGCWDHNKKKETPSSIDLTVTGGSDDAEKAMREYCQAMGQRSFEQASLYIWQNDWFDDPQNLEYERKIFIDNLYKQGWAADDRDFSKFEILSKTPKGNDTVEMKVSIGSRKGFYTEYPYKVVRHKNHWYVQIESSTGTFGLNL